MNFKSFLIVAIALMTLGCNSAKDMGPTGRVSGVLKNNGRILSPATQVVFLHSLNGTAAYGGTDEQGAFSIDSLNDGDLPIGVYRVMIQPPESQLGMEDELSAEEMLENSAKPKKQVAEFPFKYRQLSTSGLEFDVKEGDNQFLIDLK
ncbi:hypothetical protein [Blastopirellula retiformator]|uniref:Carboxypeptidase regulatory-like domain-containing protein n=1 Tax=Blastopirellula retiformator TaxID=2527970 RepID=A0A5C5V4Z8_9BACT|nr:hypothetical protein [Blastopirellula retiformator]TWT32802.1 hypothetical protein Enr8_26080 [Blastopirellula retiformator]